MTTRRLAAVAAVSIAVGSAPATAAADTPVPGDPAIIQYVEQVPTLGGTVLAGTGSQRAPLPRRAKNELRNAGVDRPALTAIATSSRYGAPQPAVRRKPATTRPASPGD